MGEDGYGGDGQGYAGEGISESGQAPDYSGSFMSTSDLPGIDGISSLGAGMLDTAQYAYEPSLINDYSPMNVESTMSTSDLADLYGEDAFSGVRKAMNHPIAQTLLTLAQLNPATRAFAGALGLAKAGINMGGPQGSKAAGSFFGGQVGNLIGTATNIPGANVVGSQIGSRVGGQAGLPGYSGPSMAGQPGSQGGSPNMDMMTGGLMGLGSLYQGMRNSREIGGQLNGLQSLYGQNSPYAQAMRQQLARKDAASGRRSQYGPREVELQARLAQMASSQAPTMANLLRMQQGNRGQTLGNLAGIYQQMGGFGPIQTGLTSLYNQFSGNGIPSGMETLAPYDYGNLNPENYYAPIPDIPDFGGDFGG